nr:cyclic nucleotide-binding domain-containing protein [Oleiphilus messinensis]
MLSVTKTEHLADTIESILKSSLPVLHRHDRIFKEDDPFTSLYIVRVGAVKTFVKSDDGTDQITNFHLPGDIIGTDGFVTGRYGATAAALETTTVCELPYPKIEFLTTKIPELQRFLFQKMAYEIQQHKKMSYLLSRRSAEQKLATLLINTSRHLEKRRLLNTSFTLPMTRTDLSNYLGLAIETVSRVLTRFHKMKIVTVEGRQITILNKARLLSIAKLDDQNHRRI